MNDATFFLSKCIKHCTYVDAVRVRLVIMGLGNCNCELLIERFGELSGDDIFNFNIRRIHLTIDSINSHQFNLIQGNKSKHHRGNK